jgi:catalase
MQDEPRLSHRYRLWPINRRILVGVSVVGAVTIGIIACFAFVGGLFSSGRLTQTRMVDAFEQINGVHPGFRRNHAKGVCIAGHFDSNGNGARLSKAVVFEPGCVPVIGRFALAGGNPFIADNPMQVRSMALSFRPPKGEEWRTGMNDIPVFPVKDAKGFYDFLFATWADPATGKPDPERMTAFFAAHPEAKPAVQLIKVRPFSTGFNNASYNALDAFRFVNAGGESTPVRWSMVAVDPFVPESPEPAVPSDENYLFDSLSSRIERGPVQWDLVLTIGQPGDLTNDPTTPWPPARERINAGRLTIDHIEAEAPNNCRDVNFDPLVLPSGIEPSDDPLLSARSATYSTSFMRRAGEKKTPSEVQIPEADKGT